MLEDIVVALVVLACLFYAGRKIVRILRGQEGDGCAFCQGNETKDGCASCIGCAKRGECGTGDPTAPRKEGESGR